MIMLDEKSDDQKSVFKIHHEGNVNMWTKFHGKTSNSGWDASLKTTNVSFTVALQEKTGVD